MGVRDNAPIGDDCLPQGGAVDLAPGQKARVSIDRRRRLKKTILRQQIRQVEIRFVKGADRSDVFPVPVENVTAHLPLLDRLRDNVFPKVHQVVVQAFHQDVPVKYVNAHRGLI